MGFEPFETAAPQSRRSRWGGAIEVFVTFLGLGLTSFGGPIAHLGYFRRAFVVRRRWLDEAVYAEIIALCSFLPGPTSSQAGILIGTLRAGFPGAFAAWLGFTLPSAVVMTLAAAGLPFASGQGWIHGLLLAAVAVVADAILGMASTLVPDAFRFALALVCAGIALRLPGAGAQIGVLVLGAAVGTAFLQRDEEAVPTLRLPVSRRAGAAILTAFGLLFAAVTVLATSSSGWRLVDGFLRAGSLVFGGGHVVLPLLQASFVPGAIDVQRFLAGYAAAQAMPGPLFTFAAYLGAAMTIGPGGWLGALIATCSIFAPSFFLLFGIAPFWLAIRENRRAAAAVRGLGTAVVGLLAAAFVNPIWTSAIAGWSDLAIAGLIFALLRLGKLPPWGAIALAAVLGEIAARV